MTGYDAVKEMLQCILPSDVAVAVWNSGMETALYPEEAMAIERAVDSRRAEFSRGRACAREALSELGLPPQPIPVGAHRQPVWPLGVVGSITHCKGLVVAVAAMTSELPAIGLDAELARPLPPSIRPLILHPSEMFADGDDPLLETVVFSAKESIHKTLFPHSGIWLDFLDVELQLDPKHGIFHPRPAAGAQATNPRLGDIRGRFSVGAGFVITTGSLGRGGCLG